MIKVNSNIDINSIEHLYAELFSFEGKKASIDMALPLDITFNGFGAFSAFIQFLFTWNRFENSGNLLLGFDGSISDDAIKIAVEKYYGFLSSVMSWHKEILTADGINIKDKIKPYNRELRESLINDFKNASWYDSIILPFFDHIDNNIGLLPIAYNGNVLKDENDFHSLTQNLINVLTQNNISIRDSIIKIADDLNGILFELFENTHKWARKSYTGAAIRPSARGIYARLYKLEVTDIDKYIKSPGLDKYFKAIKSRQKSYRYISFIELTVFDSGSGLVQQYSGKPLETLSLQDEYLLLRECLMKNNTSHIDLGEAQGRGLGLHRIMELLDKESGFLTIRSGRMNMYRDFLNFNFKPSAESNYSYSLVDWDSNTSFPSGRNKLTGTFITMIIPYPIFE